MKTYINRQMAATETYKPTIKKKQRQNSYPSKTLR